MSKEHSTRTRVRYGETDKMGVVYHANFLLYFEIGRTELMREAGLTYREMEGAGYRLVVTEAGCRYRSAAQYDDLLDIRTRVTSVGHVKVRFDYRVLRDDRVVVEGHTILACLDGSERPTRLPSEIGDRLKEWLADMRPEK